MSYTKNFTILFDLGKKYKESGIDKAHSDFIISRPGEKKLSLFLYKNKIDSLSLLHASTDVYIYVCDKRGKHYIKLKFGDIMLFMVIVVTQFQKMKPNLKPMQYI